MKSKTILFLEDEAIIAILHKKNYLNMDLILLLQIEVKKLKSNMNLKLFQKTA